MKNEMTIDGEVTRFCSARYGVSVFRQKYRDSFTQMFYMKKMVIGRRAFFPLGVERRAAGKLADEICAFLSIQSNTLDMAKARYYPRQGLREENVTFETILTTYKGGLAVVGRRGKPVSESSYTGYRSCLLTALRKVEAHRAKREFESFSGRSNIDFSQWTSLRVDTLTPKWVNDLKLASLAEANPDDQDEILSAQITCDMHLRNLKGLFSVAALKYYGVTGLKLPNLIPFQKELDFGAKKYFVLLPPDVIENIMKDSLELRIGNLDAYRAFILTMMCGLRRGEAVAFDVSSLELGDRPSLIVRVKGKFNPKHGHGRKVAISRWVFDLLTELGPLRTPDVSLDYLNDWVKGRIPTAHKVEKPIHELRKCWVSYKAKAEGILAASQQAGHREIKTTVTHYADNTLPERLLPYWLSAPKAA